MDVWYSVTVSLNSSRTSFDLAMFAQNANARRMGSGSDIGPSESPVFDKAFQHPTIRVASSSTSLLSPSDSRRWTALETVPSSITSTMTR